MRFPRVIVHATQVLFLALGVIGALMPTPSVVYLTLAAWGMMLITLAAPLLERGDPVGARKDTRLAELRDAYATDEIEMDGPTGYEAEVARVLADPNYMPGAHARRLELKVYQRQRAAAKYHGMRWARPKLRSGAYLMPVDEEGPDYEAQGIDEPLFSEPELDPSRWPTRKTYE